MVMLRLLRFFLARGGFVGGAFHPGNDSGRRAFLGDKEGLVNDCGGGGGFVVWVDLSFDGDIGHFM